MDINKHTQMFFYLVSTFEMAAMQQMGKIKNPMTDKIEINLDQAQASIDMIDMMIVKTKGNLSDEESKFIESVTAQLKLNYVDELAKKEKEKKD